MDAVFYLTSFYYVTRLMLQTSQVFLPIDIRFAVPRNPNQNCILLNGLYCIFHCRGILTAGNYFFLAFFFLNSESLHTKSIACMQMYQKKQTSSSLFLSVVLFQFSRNEIINKRWSMKQNISTIQFQKVKIDYTLMFTVY